MTISEKGNGMSNVEIELYNGKRGVFENARYRVRGNKYVITRNGRTVVQIDRVHVFDIGFTSTGLLSTSVRPGGAVRGNAGAGS
jgi:hypothetical protein